MKIEIAESLIYSWLRHCRLCSVVQTNWTVSPSWPTYNKDVLAKIYEDLAESFDGIWKKNTGVDQVIGQMGCDVLGLSNDDGGFSFHAVEAAFHSRTLGYGDREENCRRIIEKCAKIALALYGKLNQKTAEIIFVSPKIGKPTVEDIKKQMDILQNTLSKYGLAFKIEICANEDFSRLMGELLEKVSPNQADDNELFMRAALMMQVSGLTPKEPCRRQRDTTYQASSNERVGNTPATPSELAKILAPKLSERQGSKINIFDDFADMFMQTRAAYRNTYRSRQIDVAYNDIFGYNPFEFCYENIGELIRMLKNAMDKCTGHLDKKIDPGLHLEWLAYNKNKTAGTANSLMNQYKGSFLPCLIHELKNNM